jgi:cold-inducible RNA-binding protein
MNQQQQFFAGQQPFGGQPQQFVQQPMMIGGPRPMAPGGYPINPQVAYQQNQQANFLTEQMANMNLGGQGQRSGNKPLGKQQRKEILNQYPSLYVSNLPKENFLDLDFYRLFFTRGYRVRSAKIVLDSKTSRSRGYGYLQFVDQTEADRCMNEMNNTVLHGQALRIVTSLSNPKEKFNENANVYVKDLSTEVSQ